MAGVLIFGAGFILTLKIFDLWMYSNTLNKKGEIFNFFGICFFFKGAGEEICEKELFE